MDHRELDASDDPKIMQPIAVSPADQEKVGLPYKFKIPHVIPFLPPEGVDPFNAYLDYTPTEIRELDQSKLIGPESSPESPKLCLSFVTKTRSYFFPFHLRKTI